MGPKWGRRLGLGTIACGSPAACRRGASIATRPAETFSVVQRYYDTTMAKEKVTLTLDADQLEDLRRITGARSLSAAVDAAVAAYLARLRHLASVDEWLAELEREHGPIPNETLDWAANLVDEWERSQSASGLRAG
jgi:hypothetical protein